MTSDEGVRKFKSICAVEFEKVGMETSPSSVNMALAEVFGHAYVEMRMFEYYEKIREQKKARQRAPRFLRWFY